MPHQCVLSNRLTSSKRKKIWYKAGSIFYLHYKYVNMRHSLRYVIYIMDILLIGPLISEAKRYSDITSAEIIIKAGFPSEIHLVTTDDGYILTLHRIPGPPGSTPVFMQHGLVESSTMFLYNGKNRSLAFLLHQIGYDVWLGNARGNTYSRLHKNLSISDPAFWDFGWDELGLYDNPAAISYIYNKTNKKLFYIGHSMGCTTFAVSASSRLGVAQNIIAMFALAPGVYGTHTKQPIFKLLAPFWREILFVSRVLGIHEVMSRNVVLNFMTDYLCPIFLIQSIVCNNILFFIGGFNRRELPKDLAPKILSHLPAGTSIKLLVQYFQQLQVAKLRQFNYPSVKKNLELYGSHEPPEYNISKIQVPIAVFYSHNDWLVSAEDAQRFYQQIPNKLGIYAIEPYSHFDFLIGRHAPERVYPIIFKLMSQFH